MTKKEDNVFFLLSIMFLFSIFGHNLTNGKETQEERERKYFKEAVQHIRYGNGKEKEALEDYKNVPPSVWDKSSEKKSQVKCEEKTKKKEEVVANPGKHIRNVTATRYNPVASQCDQDPLTTADGKKINLKKLRNGSLKWIAISRDLKKHLKYGDIVRIKSTSNKEINGLYEVHDVMNDRHHNRIDILTATNQSGKETTGYYENVQIFLVKRA